MCSLVNKHSEFESFWCRLKLERRCHFSIERKHVLRYSKNKFDKIDWKCWKIAFKQDSNILLLHSIHGTANCWVFISCECQSSYFVIDNVAYIFRNSLQSMVDSSENESTCLISECIRSCLINSKQHRLEEKSIYYRTSLKFGYCGFDYVFFYTLVCVPCGVSIQSQITNMIMIISFPMSPAITQHVFI